MKGMLETKLETPKEPDSLSKPRAVHAVLYSTVAWRLLVATESNRNRLHYSSTVPIPVTFLCTSTVLFRPDVQSRVTATSELNTCEPASRVTPFSEQSTK